MVLVFLFVVVTLVIQSQSFKASIDGLAVCKCATGARGPRPWRGFTHGQDHCNISQREGVTRQGHDGDGLGRGGHRTGSERRLGRQEVQDRGDRRGEGERGDHENTLQLGVRVLVH